MTSGEIILATSVFGNAIDYTRVSVDRGSYFPFSLQNENTAVTPNGNSYFMPRHYQDDFLRAAPAYQHWFIYEMAHVWQHQLGLNVKFRGALSWAASYRYRLADHKLLSDYGMEAQASMIADYFWLVRFGFSGFDFVSNLEGEERDTRLIKRYQWVMRGFISHPSSRINLP
ncbi:hypothetical protein [Rosenbergiella australiborealis]|uniref:hypothetical protein n=1 Tax=Rosenbergiella australiborealis TaxID=1544696 RepID=UPI001FD314DB|nr:hypothetical protein [Rosenbergiella australiborealis]